ncbi:hypothetical protein Tco_0128228 [Tanacetum coccineum]
MSCGDSLNGFLSKMPLSNFVEVVSFRLQIVHQMDSDHFLSRKDQEETSIVELLAEERLQKDNQVLNESQSSQEMKIQDTLEIRLLACNLFDIDDSFYEKSTSRLAHLSPLSPEIVEACVDDDDTDDDDYDDDFYDCVDIEEDEGEIDFDISKIVDISLREKLVKRDVLSLFRINDIREYESFNLMMSRDGEVIVFDGNLTTRKGLKRQKEAKTIKNQQETGKRQRVKSKSEKSARDHSRISPTQQERHYAKERREKRIAEESAKERYWKIPICDDDVDNDYSIDQSPLSIVDILVPSQDCPDCEDSQFCHSSRVSHPQLHLGIRYPNLID